MSSPPASAPKRPRRPSKFIEGDPLTRPDLLQRTTTSNELLFNILSEMDALEKRRKHRYSSSSIDSQPSNRLLPSPIVGKPEVRRSFGISRPSLDEKERSHGDEKLSVKFKGRLRAFTTGGREKDEEKMSSYHGT